MWSLKVIHRLGFSSEMSCTFAMNSSDATTDDPEQPRRFPTLSLDDIPLQRQRRTMRFICKRRFME